MLCRIKQWMSTTRTAVALVCILLVAGRATAVADNFGPFTPSKVFIDHTFTTLELQEGASPTPAFASKSVTCPAKHIKGCTILVETTVSIWDVPGNGAMLEWFLVDGVMNDITGLDGTQGSIPSQRTFQYVSLPTQAGSTVTVDVQLQNLFGTAHAGDRVETIELLLN
jgi:hypothetical protein